MHEHIGRAYGGDKPRQAALNPIQRQFQQDMDRYTAQMAQLSKGW